MRPLNFAFMIVSVSVAVNVSTWVGNTLADKVAGDVLMKGVRDMILDERQIIPNNFDPSQVDAIRLQTKKKQLEKVQNDASAKD